MQFSETIIFQNRTLDISGVYEVHYGPVDHKGYIQNGEIKSFDVYGHTIRPRDITIQEITENEKEVNILDFLPDDLLALHELLVDKLEVYH